MTYSRGRHRFASVYIVDDNVNERDLIVHGECQFEIHHRPFNGHFHSRRGWAHHTSWSSDRLSFVWEWSSDVNNVLLYFSLLFIISVQYSHLVMVIRDDEEKWSTSSRSRLVNHLVRWTCQNEKVRYRHLVERYDQNSSNEREGKVTRCIHAKLDSSFLSNVTNHSMSNALRGGARIWTSNKNNNHLWRIKSLFTLVSFTLLNSTRLIEWLVNSLLDWPFLPAIDSPLLSSYITEWRVLRCTLASWALVQIDRSLFLLLLLLLFWLGIISVHHQVADEACSGSSNVFKSSTHQIDCRSTPVKR
jgi:hypothetical protein